MLPLADLPAEWTVGKSGERHLESFNADNLYEKIDGRAESFIQYGVKGMAYAFYHPTGDPSNELQLYIFEMADPLKALGQVRLREAGRIQDRPDRQRGLHNRRQHALLLGAVLHSDRLDAGRPQIRRVRAGTGQTSRRAAEAGRCRGSRRTTNIAITRLRPTRRDSSATVRPQRAGTLRPPAKPGQPNRPNQLQPRSLPRRSSPSCRPRDGRETPSTSPRMSLATAFSPTSSWPITRRGTIAWQGFLRPYRDAQEAKAVLREVHRRRQERWRRSQNTHDPWSR